MKMKNDSYELPKDMPSSVYSETVKGAYPKHGKKYILP
jgi:hypothetical protein